MPMAFFYTCPRHPEVRRDAPGVCPKCGTKLAPEPGRWHDRSTEAKTLGPATPKSRVKREE